MLCYIILCYFIFYYIILYCIVFFLYYIIFIFILLYIYVYIFIIYTVYYIYGIYTQDYNVVIPVIPLVMRYFVGFQWIVMGYVWLKHPRLGLLAIPLWILWLTCKMTSSNGWFVGWFILLGLPLVYPYIDGDVAFTTNVIKIVITHALTSWGANPCRKAFLMTNPLLVGHQGPFKCQELGLERDRDDFPWSQADLLCGW